MIVVLTKITILKNMFKVGKFLKHFKNTKLTEEKLCSTKCLVVVAVMAATITTSAVAGSTVAG